MAICFNTSKMILANYALHVIGNNIFSKYNTTKLRTLLTKIVTSSYYTSINHTWIRKYTSVYDNGL